MKTIQLIRHAKSSWENTSLSDHNRPLSERGLRDTGLMSSALYDGGIGFQHIYSSSAIRAQMTVENIASQWQGQPMSWQTSKALYTFSSETIWHWLNQLDDDISHLTLVGHNPALTDFINESGAMSLENLPTCGFLSVSCDTPIWANIQKADCQLMQFFKPKMFKK